MCWCVWVGNCGVGVCVLVAGVLVCVGLEIGVLLCVVWLLVRWCVWAGNWCVSVCVV